MRYDPYRLYYDHPAPKWEDGENPYQKPEQLWEAHTLPLGNGWFGACVYGYPGRERVQITENSLCNPFATPANRPGVRLGLQNFCELYFAFGHEPYTGYWRELSLDRAELTETYLHGGVRYTRTFFASYPAGVLAIRFTADQPGKITFTAGMDLPFCGEYCEDPGDGCGRSGEVTAEGNTVTGGGTMSYYRISYEGMLRVLPKGGEVTTDGTAVTVTGADEAVVLFTCGTNYRLESRVFTEPDPKRKIWLYPHPHRKNAARLLAAEAQGWEKLFNEHLSDYKQLFGRVHLRFGKQNPNDPDLGRTTDTLLARYREGNESRYLEALLYQFGRYLLICSSRAGHLPPNLQGIWSAYRGSPWSGGYWHNINEQMNYWGAWGANLAELFLPYADFYAAYHDLATQTADKYVQRYDPERYAGEGRNGWFVYTGVWPYTMDTEPRLFHSGPGTGAFTSLLFWDHFEYTQDLDFLRKVGYPALRGMALFFSRILVEKDGKQLVEHSASPENIDLKTGESYQTVGCAFDQQMIAENDRRTLQAAALLGITDDPVLEAIRAREGKLDPVLIGEDGQVKEYREERHYADIGEPEHRHISQLVGLYPGFLIRQGTEEGRAAAATLDKRGDKSTGWAMAHRLCLWARLGNGKRAMDLCRQMLRTGILPNLWDTHPPFQIDGNFGYVAGVGEMLVGFRGGAIRLLPSLPDEWAEGAFRGLCARGNFEIDCTFRSKTPRMVRIHSRAGGTLRVALPDGGMVMKNGRVTAPAWDGEVMTMETAPGDEIVWEI